MSPPRIDYGPPQLLVITSTTARQRIGYSQAGFPMLPRLLSSLVLACALVLAGPILRASADQQLADARILLLTTQSDEASKALRIDEALARAEEAIALAETLGDRVGLAMAHQAKGITLNRGSRIRESLPWYERALSEFEALGNQRGVAGTLVGMNAAAIQLGDTAKAREYGERALHVFDQLGDAVGRARILINLVRSNASPQLEEARIKEIGDTGTRLHVVELQAESRRLEAGRRFNAGDLAGAREAFEAAIALYEQAPDVEAQAALYLSLGRVFRAHGDYEGALQRYQQAIELLAPTRERYTLVEAVNSSAVALGYLKRTRESIAAYERGLALAKESGNQRVIDFMEGNLATGLMQSGEYARAIPLIEAAIAKKPETIILGFRYVALAQALTQVGRAAEAVAPVTESIRIARGEKNLDSLPSRLANRAWIYTKLGRLEEALADMRETVALTEQTRTRLLPSDFLKRGYSDRAQIEYVRIADILSRLGSGAEALAFTEQGRARAFLDLLAAREAGASGLATRRDAAAVTGGTRGDVASTATGRPLDLAGIQQVARRLKTSVVTYSVDDDATLIWVLPPEGAPTHVRVPIAREKVAALVAATTAPLRESAGAAPTRGGDDDASVPEPADADDLTALPMRGLGLLALSRDNRSAWRDLYKTLIEPVRSALPARGARLTIVPHGPLFQLSFAALQNAAGRYLIEDYELHYAPAASALEFTGRRQQTVAANAAGPWAIVGNPAALPLVRDRPLPPLPGAEREIASVAALAPRGRALRLDGAGADEAALAHTLDTSHPSVLHFATHGFVFDDPKTPPFLALNRRGKTDADDGRLTLDEVYGLHLRTDLVVLSACRTGSGRVSADGVVGLTRGFFYAGTPSVVATFWDVTDEATSILMSRFYLGYAKARTKGPSLRAAQLALLAELRAGNVVVSAAGRRVTLPEHPLLWAAFFLSGEP
jgi:CHAT domain-containing protein/tetratricopeptide (TPR) repeat protein